MACNLKSITFAPKKLLKMDGLKKNIFIAVFFAVLSIGFGYFVEACCAYDGKKVAVDETLVTCVTDEPGQYGFFDVEAYTLQATINVGISFHFSIFDGICQYIFKNIQRQQTIGKTNLIKLALKNALYDTNSSHFYFPCRYHVVALREIII